MRTTNQDRLLSLKVKDEFIKNYPKDELGLEIKDNITFGDLFEFLDRHQGSDIYEFIGVCDSIVREGIFTLLSDIIEMPYEYVYNQWLGI